MSFSRGVPDDVTSMATINSCSKGCNRKQNKFQINWEGMYCVWDNSESLKRVDPIEKRPQFYVVKTGPSANIAISSLLVFLLSVLQVEALAYIS
jgi:hypothetical protein